MPNEYHGEPTAELGRPRRDIKWRVPLVTIPDYDQQKTIHGEIASLYPRIVEAQCHFRAPATDTSQAPSHSSKRAVIDRDRAICAIANKLVTTQHAILVLCESQLGDDAYALSRVAMENAVIFAWLLNEKAWCKRIDLYVNSYYQAQSRLNEIDRKHHGDTVATAGLGELTTEEEAIVKDLFNGQWRKWAVVDGRELTFRQMAEEVLESDFFYERVFLETSWFVHSGFRSCLDTISELLKDDCYDLRVRHNKRTAAYALFLSNMAALLALDALNGRTPIALSTEIDRMFSRLREATVRGG